MTGILVAMCALGIGMTLGSIGLSAAARRANHQIEKALEDRHLLMAQLWLQKAREG